MNLERANVRSIVSIVFVAVACIAASFGILDLVNSTDGSPLRLVALIAVGILVLAACLVVPTHWLPFAALVVFSLAPQRLIPDQYNAIPPSSVILLVWAIRRGLATEKGQRTPRGAVTILYALLLVWLVFSTLFSIEPMTSILWVIVFVTTTLPMFVIRDANQERTFLVRGWTVFGAILGLYGSIELVLGKNLVYDYIYSFSAGGNGQHWDTYRSSISFGSPVFAGLFFACSTALALSSWSNARNRFGLLILLANAAGLVSTLTRGGFLALAIALVLGTLVAITRRGVGNARVLIAGAIMAAFAAIAVYTVPALTERIFSDEASGSLNQRARTIDIVFEKYLEYPVTGAGPDTSFTAIGSEILNLRYIENSYLQLLLSVSIIGVVLFLLLGVALALRSFRNKDIEAVMLVAAFFVGIGTYNAIDDQHGTLVLLGLVVLVALNRGRSIVNSSELEGIPMAQVMQV